MTTRTLHTFLLFWGSSLVLWHSALAGENEDYVELKPVTVLVPDVSIFEVLANAKNFAGKDLCFVGVLSFGGSNRLSVAYSSLESRDYRILVNGIALHFETTSQVDQLSKMDGKYVAIWGTLETDSSRIHQFLSPLDATLVNGRLLRVRSMGVIGSCCPKQ